METYLTIEQKIESIFNHAEFTCQTSQQLVEEYKKLLGRLNERTKSGKRKYPVYMSTYARGYIQAKRNEIMRNKVEYCYNVKGELYSTAKVTLKNKVSELIAKGNGHLLKDIEGHFYWLETDKIYF